MKSILNLKTTNLETGDLIKHKMRPHIYAFLTLAMYEDEETTFAIYQDIQYHRVFALPLKEFTEVFEKCSVVPLEE